MLVMLMSVLNAPVAVNRDQVRYLKTYDAAHTSIVFGKTDSEHSLVVKGRIHDVFTALSGPDANYDRRAKD